MWLNLREGGCRLVDFGVLVNPGCGTGMWMDPSHPVTENNHI